MFAQVVILIFASLHFQTTKGFFLSIFANFEHHFDACVYKFAGIQNYTINWNIKNDKNY